MVLAERRLDHLAIGAAQLEPLVESLALDLDHPGPPGGVVIDIDEELPDDLDRCLDERLLAGFRHRRTIMAASPEELHGAWAGPRPVPIMASRSAEAGRRPCSRCRSTV